MFGKSNLLFTLTLAVILFASVGTYLILTSQAATTLNADFNGDSVVNVIDLSILSTNWGKTSTTHTTGDANNDSTVNIYDLSVLANEWGQTITPSITPTPIPTTIVTNTYNVMDYGAHADGKTDDSLAVYRAIEAANKGNGTVYFPAGTYNILPTGALDSGDSASPNRLAIPVGTKITGAGINATHILGKLNIKSNCEFRNIRLGIAEGATYIAGSGCIFDSVRTSGGGHAPGGPSNNFEVTWPWCDGAVLTIFGSNNTFNDCIFDGTPQDDSTHVAKWNNIAAFGTSNLSFNRCHFEHSGYFSIELWASEGSYSGNNFSYCTFDTSTAAHIDYAQWGENNSTVDHCTFAASGVGPYAHDPGDVTIEAGPNGNNITVSNCTFMRSAWCNITVQGAGHDMTIINNKFDNTAGQADVPLYSRSGEAIYAGGDGASRNNHITGNVITSPSGENEWRPAINVTGNNNIITGNIVRGWKNISVDYPGTILVLGTGNITTPNSIY